ncbi:MAG: TonB-dependent receptor plug domain-containing protein, partial [Gammaproteobacteria bacterium]|nr:TonB-dependent receptor plug domain-containing protein [Gammaproteobacteria bacterium]
MKAHSKLSTLAIVGIIMASGAWGSTPAFAAEEVEELILEEVILEEVIISARRRDEKLMDVPDAITVISKADMDLLVLDSMADYLRQIPGTILVNGGPEYLSDISMRGQGGGRLGFSESATGIYRNGSYIAGGGFGGRSLSRMDFFDMESLQAYRGPQGALYGRNAVGGAVNVISKRPSDTSEGWAKIGYDSFERTLLEAVINVPANDKFAVRFGGYYLDQDDGFITDINTGATLDRNNQKGVRIAAEARPTDAFTINLTVEYRESEVASFSSLGFRAFRTDGVPLDPGKFERDVSTDGRAEIEESTIFLGMLWQTAIGELHADFNVKNRDGNRIADDFDHFIGFQN